VPRASHNVFPHELPEQQARVDYIVLPLGLVPGSGELRLRVGSLLVAESVIACHESSAVT